MPGVCSDAVLLLETSAGSDKLVDEKTARKYTLSVVPHENKKDSSAVVLSFGWILKISK